MHKTKSLLPLLLVTFYASLLRKSSPHPCTEIDILGDSFLQPLQADLHETWALAWHEEGTGFGIWASFFFFSMLIRWLTWLDFVHLTNVVSPVPGSERITDAWSLASALWRLPASGRPAS